MLKAKKLVVLVVAVACLVGLAFPLVKAADHIETIRQVIEIVQSEYYREVDPLTLVKGALKGIMEAVNDPHSNYMPPAEYDSFWERATGEYIGIGITYEMTDAGLKVVQVVRGSPADREGILINDIILTADGISLAGTYG